MRVGVAAFYQPIVDSAARYMFPTPSEGGDVLSEYPIKFENILQIQPNTYIYISKAL